MKIRDLGIYYGAVPVPAAGFLSQCKFRVLNSISSYQGPQEYWVGSINKILERVNGFEIRGIKGPKEIKYKRCSQIIQTLKKEGWLEVEKSGFRGTNKYSLRIPDGLLFLPEHSYTISRFSKTSDIGKEAPGKREIGNKAVEKRDSNSRSMDANEYRTEGSDLVNKEKKEESRKEHITNVKKNAKLEEEEVLFPFKERDLKEEISDYKELLQNLEEECNFETINEEVAENAKLGGFIKTPPREEEIAFSQFKDWFYKEDFPPRSKEKVVKAESVFELQENHRLYFEAWHVKHSKPLEERRVAYGV